MTIDLDDVRRHFALLSDHSLLAVKRDDLVEAAQQVLDEEIARRKPVDDVAADPGPEPSWQEAAETVSEEGAAADAKTPEAELGAVALIASYTHPDEARLARGLLEVAGIPSFLANEQTALGAIQLLVPADRVEEALEVLADELSEEELAAQAEAAGFADGEEFDEEAE